MTIGCAMGIYGRWRFQKILGPCATKSLSLTVASGVKSPPTTARHRHQHRSHTTRPPHIHRHAPAENDKYTHPSGPSYTVLVHPSSCAGIEILPFIFHHSSMTLCSRPFMRGRHEEAETQSGAGARFQKQRFFTTGLSLVPACR